MEKNIASDVLPSVAGERSGKKRALITIISVLIICVGVVSVAGSFLKNKRNEVQQEVVATLATSTQAGMYQSIPVCNEAGFCVSFYNGLGMLKSDTTLLETSSYLDDGYCGIGFSGTDLDKALTSGMKDSWLNRNSVNICHNLFASETFLIVVDRDKQLKGNWPIESLGGMAGVARSKEYNTISKIRFEGNDILWDERGGHSCTVVDQTYRIKYVNGYYEEPKLEKDKVSYCD